MQLLMCYNTKVDNERKMISSSNTNLVLWMIMYLNVVPIVCSRIKQLWPLDSQTCESEVLIDPFQYKTECNWRFETQPYGIPYRSMVFDESYINVRVEFPTTGIEHYSVEGLFYFTESKGVLFHYKADQLNKEVILWYANGKISLYRKVKSSLSQTYTQSFSIALNNWYYISFGIGSVGYVYAYINGTRQLYGEIGKRTSKEIPGNLRIGGDFDGTKPRFSGMIACVGFFWNSKNGLVSDLLWQCQSAPWMPQRKVNNLYFSSTNDTELFPKLIKSEEKSSMIQCAYTCLQNSQCFYIHCNETNVGCNPCYMYDRTEQTYSVSQTLDLYKVKP